MLMTLTGPMEAKIRSQGAALALSASEEIRTDSRASEGPGVAETRAALRAHARKRARLWAAERADLGMRTDERELGRMVGEYLEAIAPACGLRADQHSVRLDGYQRRDATFLTGDLTDRAAQPIMQPRKPYGLTDAIPVRSVASWAMRATHVAVTGSGDMATVNPGDTQIPRITADASENGARILTGAVQTSIPWGADIFSARAAFSEEAALLERAQVAALDWRERLLALGAPGVDSAGVSTAPLPVYTSPNDYSGTVTMDAVRADFVAFVHGIASASEFRRGGRKRLIIGDRLATAAFLRGSNYAAGGSSTAPDILRALREVLAGMELLGAIGSITIAPSLAGVRVGAAYDTAIALPDDGTMPPVQQAVAIGALTPAHTFTGEAGTSTYWILRQSALDIQSILGAGLMVAKVA
jgi:hypothetical protein